MPPTGYFSALSNPNTTVTKLSEILSIDTGALSRVLSKLSSQDLINRTRDENDQRIVHLNLSSNGLEIFRELKEELYRHLSNRFSDFTKEQLDELILALKIIEQSTPYIKNI
ncbi:MarR family winged helix-turn-helix transcriptional regulator [Clostridium sp. DL1XJH146]